jgi:hypothetical protein
VVVDGAEGDIIVELAQLRGDCGVHFEDAGTCALRGTSQVLNLAKGRYYLVYSVHT